MTSNSLVPLTDFQLTALLHAALQEDPGKNPLLRDVQHLTQAFAWAGFTAGPAVFSFHDDTSTHPNVSLVATIKLWTSGGDASRPELVVRVVLRLSTVSLRVQDDLSTYRGRMGVARRYAVSLPSPGGDEELQRGYNYTPFGEEIQIRTPQELFAALMNLVEQQTALMDEVELAAACARLAHTTNESLVP